MKIVELLNKIANEEEVPKKLSYKNKTYLFDGEILNYVNEYNQYDFLLEEDITAILNDEVEIIKENKLKQLENYAGFTNLTNEGKLDYLYEMVSKITDKVNELENNNEFSK